MRILLDTDVLLDLFLDRSPFADAAAILWQANEKGDVTAYVSSITSINIYYIARKLRNEETARQAVVELLAVLRVCPTDQAALSTAIALPMRDYEDAVQVACAMSANLEAIVTRNLDDYQSSPISAYSPIEFINSFLSESN